MTLKAFRAELRRHHFRSLLILAVVAAACFFAARTYVLSVGGRHVVTIDSLGDVTLTAENIQVTPPDIVSVGSIEKGPGETHRIEFIAGNPGKGIVLVNASEAGMMFEIETTSDGVVVDGGLEFTGWQVVFASIIAVISTIAILCIWTFVWLWRRSWYGYEMAAAAGAALFFTLQALSFVGLTINDTITTFSDVIFAIIRLAGNFVDFTLIPMALLAFFVCTSNISLLRHEGRRPTNMLGVMATLLWAGTCFGLHVFRGIDPDTFVLFVVHLFADSIFSMIVSFMVALFLGVCFTALLAARHVPSFPRDAIIILGCGLRGDGTPTPLLAGRVDAARSYAERQQAAGHPQPLFVPSGGQGPDEVMSEARSMGNYLMAHGVDETRIALEDRSTTTRENMAFSAEVLAAHGLDQRPLAFSTTNYHILRGYVYAQQAGLVVEGIAAPTRLYFWPNAFLREFVGMLAARAVPIAVACLAIAALYGVAEYLVIFV